MTLGEAMLKFGFDLDKSSVSTVENTIKNVKSMATKVLGAIGVVFTVAGLSDLAQAAADAEATASQFTQVFGDMEDQATASLSKIAEDTGIVTSRLKGSYTQIAAFAKTTGMETADALDLTNRSMKAVADSAAFYDRSLEDVTVSLQSFLKGNFENDAALGLSCTETTRNAVANALYGKSFKDLAENQKQLTLLQMVEDANKLSGALGQAERESETWSNQLGNLKQSITDFRAAVGKTFLTPAINTVKAMSSGLQYLTAQIPQVVAGFKTWANSTFGVTNGENNLLRELKSIFATIKVLKPAVDRTIQTTANGLTKIIQFFVRVITRLGETKNAMKLLAIVAGVLMSVLVATSFIKFINNAKKMENVVKALHKVFNVANLKVLALVAVLVILALIIEDFINFMQGNDSVIGIFFDKAGIGAENARVTIVKAWEKIKEFLLGVWEFLKQAVVMWVDNIKGFFERHSESIRKNVERAWGIIKTFLSGVWMFLLQLADTIFGDTKDSIDESTTSIKDKLLAVWGAILNALSVVWDALYEAGSAIFNAIATVIEVVFGWIQIFWGAWGSTILTWFKGFWDNLGQFINGFLEVIKGLANFISSVFTGDWSGAWSAIKDIFGGIWDMITAILQQAWSTISTVCIIIFTGIASLVSSTFSNILSGIIRTVGSIKDAIVNGLTSAINWIKGLPSQALQWGADIINGIANGIKNAIGKVTDAVSGVASKIKSFLHFSVPDEGPLTDYESWMPDFMGGLAKGISNNEDIVLDKVKGLASGISTLMSAATANIGTASTSTVNNTTSSIVQNVDISNSYSGGSTEVQKNVSKAMKKSAVDATTQMARALAYARG